MFSNQELQGPHNDDRGTCTHTIPATQWRPTEACGALALFHPRWWLAMFIAVSGDVVRVETASASWTVGCGFLPLNFLVRRLISGSATWSGWFPRTPNHWDDQFSRVRMDFSFHHPVRPIPPKDPGASSRRWGQWEREVEAGRWAAGSAVHLRRLMK